MKTLMLLPILLLTSCGDCGCGKPHKPVMPERAEHTAEAIV